MPNNLRIAFFGTSDFSVKILDELKKESFVPSLIIAGEDKPRGRKLAITPPPAKVWAEKNNVPMLQPKTLKDASFAENLKKSDWDLFIVASYGKIIPGAVLEIPKHKTLNVHPSLLPKLRGASPIRSAILEEKETGVTIMRLDEEMDHGPVVAQKKVPIQNWPADAETLENILAEEGGKLLSQTIPDWISGKIKETPQNHTLATYCKKIEKEDGLINLSDSPEKNFRKIQAYRGWPTAYFFIPSGDKKIRVIIKEAELKDGNLIIKKILPEGGKETDYQIFLKNLGKK